MRPASGRTWRTESEQWERDFGPLDAQLQPLHRPGRLVSRGDGHDSAYWDDVIRSWEPSVGHRLWRAHSDAVNGRLLSRWLPSSGGTVLKTDLFDEAVARGLVPELARRFEHVVGIDVSSVAVRAASRRYPDLDAEVADVLSLPFADRSFDAVVSNSTLDHFHSHTSIGVAVGELARVLRPQGHLIVTLDNRLNPVVALRTSLLFGALHRLGVVPYFVGATYGALGLCKVLEHNGLEVRAIASIMHCPPQLAAWWTARRSTQGPENMRAYVRRVLRFEAMERWPTRHLTGHFACALAVRR